MWRASGVVRGHGKAAGKLRQARRGFVSPEAPADETQGHYQEKNDERDRGVGAASARKDIRAAPPSSAVAITGLPRPPVNMVEWARRIPVNPWCQSGDAAAGDNSRCPFHHWRRIDDDSRRHDRSGDEGGGGRQSVEQVVDDRNVIGQDFREGGYAEHD